MQSRPSGAQTSSLDAIKARPLTMALPRGERRNLERRAAVVRRIAAEFREMPGLILSVKQAGRLLGLDEPACKRILDELERDGLLRRRSTGSYGRE